MVILRFMQKRRAILTLALMLGLGLAAGGIFSAPRPTLASSTADVDGQAHCASLTTACGYVELATADGSYFQHIDLGPWNYDYTFHGVPRNTDAVLSVGWFDGPPAQCTYNVHIGDPLFGTVHLTFQNSSTLWCNG